MEYRLPVCVIPFAQLEVERLLPVPGQVLVRVGDKVDATDVIARALHPGPLCAINAARVLGVGNAMLPKYVVKKEGEDVKEKEILAARGGVLGLFRKKCVSPVAGTVLAITHGRILLEQAPLTVELRANVRGEVATVIPNFGAVIRTMGALIRGAWSSGAEANGPNLGFGVLRVVVEGRDQPLTAGLVDVSCHGAIVVGGSSVEQEALEQAKEMNVRAIVVGGVDAGLRKLCRSLPFPVVATQGLGDLPMAEPMFQLLRMHQGREAVIIQWDTAWGKARPEIIIPLPLDQAWGISAAPSLEVGAHVHLTRSPYAGLVGQVMSQPQLLRDPRTGLQFLGVKVLLEGPRTEGSGNVIAPLANLELIP